ncbi:hypothetical protein [Mesorhizobium sp. M0859]|uniref:hypothetical protein n=1 Tax=Mesorhizobium sp. M0859 TaxID=2957014 RepID=UPI00333DE89B
MPTVSDRTLQRSTAEVLSAIYEEDFLPCSFGDRPQLSVHHALATLNEAIAGGLTGWVLEADLKNFFGSLSHEWMLRFVEHRVGIHSALPATVVLRRFRSLASICPAFEHGPCGRWPRWGSRRPFQSCQRFRLISLIRRWLKAGVLEDGAVHPSDEGTPQGGSISVLLSNV